MDCRLYGVGLDHTTDPGDRATLPQPHAHGYQRWEPDGALTDVTDFNTVAA